MSAHSFHIHDWQVSGPAFSTGLLGFTGFTAIECAVPVPASSSRTFMRAPSGLSGTAVLDDVRPKSLIQEAHAEKMPADWRHITYPLNGMLTTVQCMS